MTQQTRDITVSPITEAVTKKHLTITVRGIEPIVIWREDISEHNRELAFWHGIKQKLVDGAALSNGATLDEKYNAMVDIATRITGPNGEWNKRRESGEPRGGLLFNALCRAYPQRKPDEIREFLAKKSRSEQNAMLQNSRIRPHVDAIRAEMAKNIESDDLLNELED